VVRSYKPVREIRLPAGPVILILLSITFAVAAAVEATFANSLRNDAGLVLSHRTGPERR